MRKTMPKRGPLSCIPQPEIIKCRLKKVLEEARQLQILLETSERIAAANEIPQSSNAKELQNA